MATQVTSRSTAKAKRQLVELPVTSGHFRKDIAFRSTEKSVIRFLKGDAHADPAKQERQFYGHDAGG
jgi:hypothetical protein